MKRWIKALKSLLRKKGGTIPYAYRPDHTVIADYAEFAGLQLPVVVDRINSYKSLTRKEWLALPQEGFRDKAQHFYGASSYYICDILAANVSKNALREKLEGFSPLLLGSMTGHPGPKLLEFGGGTGVFCEIMADAGKDVTYLDIPGQQFEFAKWRFAKHNVPVRMLQTQPGHLQLAETFDIIFTDAVMEHLDDPYTPLAELCRSLNPGGILVLLVDLSGEEDDMPMHKDVDVKRLHAVPEAAGFANLYGRHTFASIWRKPG